MEKSVLLGHARTCFDGADRHLRKKRFLSLAGCQRLSSISTASQWNLGMTVHLGRLAHAHSLERKDRIYIYMSVQVPNRMGISPIWIPRYEIISIITRLTSKLFLHSKHMNIMHGGIVVDGDHRQMTGLSCETCSPQSGIFYNIRRRLDFFFLFFLLGLLFSLGLLFNQMSENTSGVIINSITSYFSLSRDFFSHQLTDDKLGAIHFL